MWVKSDNATDDICIMLLYERLLNFCYLCGKLGHIQRDCVIEVSTDNQLPFGNWLRAVKGVGEG